MCTIVNPKGRKVVVRSDLTKIVSGGQTKHFNSNEQCKQFSRAVPLLQLKPLKTSDLHIFATNFHLFQKIKRCFSTVQ